MPDPDNVDGVSANLEEDTEHAAAFAEEELANLAA